MNELSKELSSGIYQIRNLMNGKKYIGSAVCFRQRWYVHKSSLRKNKHHSPHLQAAWNKHGEENFAFEIILECEVEELIDYEQLCLDDECPEYNICRIAGSMLGHKFSEEAKKRMSIARTGEKRKPLSEEHKQKLRERNTGKIMPDDVRAKVAEAGRGRTHSGETKDKMSKAALGRKMTEAAKKKLAGRQISDETRKKISESRKGRVPWNKGVAHSEETKRKIAEKAKGRTPWNKGKTNHE